MESIDGNLPGPVVFWESEDGRTRIIRHCHGVFLLEYDGMDILEGSFEKVNNYCWHEFIDMSIF